MNTSQIKTFATQSRNILKTGVIQRIRVLGFDTDGNLTKGEPTRIEIQGGATLFAGEVLNGAFYGRWMSLRNRIREVGVKAVYEEAAYTWFNRLIAIRIMQKNGFIDPVLAYTNEQTRIPRIVAEARAGRIGRMSPGDREKLRELMGDDARINEQFALLIDNFCRNNAVIFNCFGGIEEYISLLLPDNILAPGGFIDLLNHTNYITDEDFKQSELIGWLYQFYISEKKDEVFDGFKKGKKAEAEDIPAATQIFTPNWIVKYMVQNTIGRIYLDNNPWATGIKESMRYLVEPAEPTPKDAILKLESLEDYKLLDNACGSGHILVEAFGLFYKMYLEEGYSSHNAIENILRKNLLGIDLDTRAKQLATFALLMTAAKIDPSFLDCKVMPRVLDMPGHNFSQPIYELLREFYMGEDRTVMEETIKAFELLEQADNLGSIMKFDLSERTRSEMLFRYREWNEERPSTPILHSIALILALTDKYTAVVTNPPYMGSGSMNASLSSYVKQYYEEGKADLFSTFMILAVDRLMDNGKYGMINMHSWMFLSSFERLRHTLLDNYHIDSLLHLGPHTFDELNGEVVQNAAFVITRSRHTSEHFERSNTGVYFRLVEGRNCSDKERLFFESDFVPKVLYQSVSQNIFEPIPGRPIAYWVNKRIQELFENETIGDKLVAGHGILTGHDEGMIRQWTDIDARKIGLGFNSAESFHESDKIYVPLAKGGPFRRWYGNLDLVIKYDNHTIESMKCYPKFTLQNEDYYFKKGASWAFELYGGSLSIRYMPQGCIFSHRGPAILADTDDDLYRAMGFLSSVVCKYFLNILNPTISCSAGVLKKVPAVKMLAWDTDLVYQNISVSRQDWDAHESSWEFKGNELIRIFKDNQGEGISGVTNPVEVVVKLYKEFWEKQFYTLHNNEEELNRHFIKIYGLQDELSSDVPLDEVTILQQGEISIEDGQLVWHDDILAKQFLSYAIGCMMGRYRLDRPGLHIAYPNPTSEDIAPYEFQGELFEIDDDGIIPLLGRDCPFDDNAYNRVVKFIRQIFGESSLNENLNYIEASLKRTIEDYFVKDFWKDHKKMYSNRPIYWLFSSKKGAFQCLTYMHRMNPYTAEAVRSKYLLPYIDFLRNKIATDIERASLLCTVERRNLDKMQKALDECLEYEEFLHDIADQQVRFDLDDGVVVNYAKFGSVLAKIK